MRLRSGRGPKEGQRRQLGHGLRRGASIAGRVLRAPGRILRRGHRIPPAGEVAIGSVTLTEDGVTDLAPVIRAPRSSGDESGVPSPPLLTGDRTMSRRVKFLIVNLCTIASLALGMTAIVLAMHGQVQFAAALLLACVAFDGLDGALARKFGVSTPFGAQMDSLADMCSFGIATPVVAYAWLVGSTPSWVVAPVCALVGACAAIRLARFNISPKSSSYFVGVPTTMAAAIIVIATLLMPEPARIVPAAFIAVVALLMVSTFPYVKLAQLRRVPVWIWIVPVVLALLSPALAFVTSIGIYLASGLFLYARGSRA